MTSSDPALGLVQEDVFKENDFIEKNLLIFTPLYLDRMYIIYNQEKFIEINKICKNGKCSEPSKRLILSPHSSLEVLRFFKHAKINTGAVGSGSLVLGSYVLKNIDSQIYANKSLTDSQDSVETQKENFREHEVSNDGIGIALEKLRKNELDVVFIFVGCNNKNIGSVLKDEKFQLASIEPSFINQINQENNVNLRITNFRNCSEESPYKDKVTFGTYVRLVGNNKANKEDVTEILNELQESKKANQEFKAIFGNDEDFDFKSYFLGQYDKENVSWKRDVAAFFLTNGVLMLTIFIVFFGIISVTKQYKYIAKMSEITKEAFPRTEWTRSKTTLEIEGADKRCDDKENLEPAENGKEKRNQLPPSGGENAFSASIVIPNGETSPVEIINHIISAISELDNLRKEITYDAQLIHAHASYLIQRVDLTIIKLRRRLFIRLDALLKELDTKEIKTWEKVLKKYVVARWIEFEDYEKLMKTFAERAGR